MLISWRTVVYTVKRLTAFLTTILLKSVVNSKIRVFDWLTFALTVANCNYLYNGPQL
jgi:hypothetical protein